MGANKKNELNNVLDAIYHETAIDVSESVALTKAELAHFGLKLEDSIAKLDTQVQSALAARRRAKLVRAHDERLRGFGTKVAEVAAMTREAVVARIEQLQLRFPDFQVAHRDLRAIPEEDLRSLLVDLEALSDSQ